MDEELVNTVVRQVLAEIGRTDAQSATGQQDAKPQAGRPQAGRSAGGKASVPTKIFITADMLSQRIGAGGGVVELAHNEFLTPNALDVVQMRNLTVRKTPKPAIAVPAADNPRASGDVQDVAKPQAANSTIPQAENSTIPQAGAAIGIVLERPDEKVAGVVGALSHDGVGVEDFTRTDCWIKNLQAMCDAVSAGSLPAGVAILKYAADAVMLANKARGIRAVQGTCSRSVSAAVRHFGANVLVLEHTFSTYHEMRTMIRAFALQRTAAGQHQLLMEAVEKLERA